MYMTLHTKNSHRNFLTHQFLCHRHRHPPRSELLLFSSGVFCLTSSLTSSDIFVPSQTQEAYTKCHMMVQSLGPLYCFKNVPRLPSKSWHPEANHTSFLTFCAPK